MRRRSQLYVPAISEKMIRKSVEIPSDTVIFDLEDSVPPDQKEKARENLRLLVKQLEWGKRELAVRINSVNTRDGLRDLLLLGELELHTVLVPKAEGDLSFVHEVTGKEIEPIVETPKGLTTLEELVRSEGVVAVSYGAADLALHAGGDLRGYEGNIYVMTAIAITAKAYDVDPVDKVFFDLKDVEGFRREALLAKSLGFVGKQVIHPSQVDVANQVFSPSKEEIEWHRKVVQAFEEAMKIGKGAIRLDDKLVDYVHYKLAKRILQDYSD
ncbi:MAG: CoA ester lyase [Metallosphaera yellowstonensis]|jgi:Citrate lyase beta subunit